MASGFIKYGVSWNCDSLVATLTAIQKGGVLEKKDDTVTRIPLYDLYKEAMTLLWPEDDWHRWSEMFLREILSNKITAVTGPQNCVAGHTRIPNPVTGECPTIKELCDRGEHPTVMTMLGPIVAGVPFLKGTAELFEVTLEDGRSFVASGQHRVLSGSSFCPVESLRCGEQLLSYDEDHLRSTVAQAQYARALSALNFQKTAQDWMDRCSVYSCPCDEQLREEGDTVQEFSPSQACAQGQHHTDSVGVLEHTQAHNHRCQFCDRLSSSPLLRLVLQQQNPCSHRFSPESSSHDDDLFQCAWLCPSETNHPQQALEPNPDSFQPLLFSRNVSYKQGDHRTTVVSIKSVGIGEFYDLNVPLTHHYFAEGAIHHNSGKTYMAAKFALTDFWAFPHLTGVLVSSTDLRGLELRVWGTIKQLFNRALDRWPDLPGNVIESLHAVTPDAVNEGYARVLKKGIICIPCLQSGRYVGLGKYVGFKMPRVRLIADEAQLMGPTFLDAISNLSGNPDFKAVIMGNPLDPMDPLGMAAEPEVGWTNMAEPTVTTVYKTKFLEGKCINFVGTDSPNFDPGNTDPITRKPKYPYMISQRTVNEVEAFWGRDSQQFWSQVMGVMKTGLLARRVITRDLCREHHALDRAEWESTERTKVYAIDAAYSGTGGDRCVGGWVEFGTSAQGNQILRVNPPVIIPVVVSKSKSPEDQIAEYVKRDIEANGIEPTHVFYDSTGRGTLGSAFARCFGERTPVPVEFGGRPSERPVRFDLFIDDDGERRLKTCREHYVDFVSELWFSVRYTIESEQLRELPEDVMREGCGREYGTAKGNKFFVESKHDPKARERMGRSPDLFDWLVTALEGARRLGFRIQKLGFSMTEGDDSGDYFLTEESEYQDIIKSKMLTHSIA